MGGEYGTVIIICPVCGKSLSVAPKVTRILINQHDWDKDNSTLVIDWKSSTIYHHCEEANT